MKKHPVLTTVLLLLTVLLLAGCGTGGAGTGTSASVTETTEGNTEPATTVTFVTVVALQEAVNVDISELETYDFTALFQITVNGDSIPVDPAYLETRRDGNNENVLFVTCSYEGKRATVTVYVARPTYSVVCSAAEVTVRQSEVAEYDFLSLFTVILNGKAVEVTQEMITSDVCDTPGDYTYTVCYGDAAATLTVHVTPDHVIEAIPSYRNLALTLREFAEFDLKDLFSLYVDGVAVPVTDDMLDTSLVSDVKEGGEYRVTLRYSVGKNSCEVQAAFRIIAEEKAVLSAKNVITYPGAQSLDLTTLFTITKNGVNIPVDRNMIEGTVDYKREGIYQITLTYEGETVTATVEIRNGVVIQFATSDLIRLQKGTNPLTYAFDSDFVVMINGLRFTDIPLSAFDLSGVDFDTPGIYPVTLTIKYNDKKLSGISGSFTFTEYKATIRYQVVKNTYSVSLGAENVVLPRGTEKYNVYQNLTVIINGRRQTLTENPAYVDSISCYVKTLSDPLDFTSAARQTVRIAVYPDGPDGDAVIVEYTVRVDAGVEVTATGTAIFAGRPLHILDLFTITADGKNVPVTNDMISGKVDTFRPGVYTVTVEYLGMTASAQVVVFDDSLAGTYRTGLITIDSMPDLETDTEEDTWGSDYGDEEGGSYSAATPPTRLTDMIINEDGSIVVGGDAATIVAGVDEHTMTIRLRNNLYTVYVRNGIAVLIPDNSLKMQYTESKRPLIYFHEAQWKIADTMTVNSTSSHVLQNSITAYSYDIFCINSLDNLQKMWYTLKINLVEKTSSDTVYNVSWGEVAFAEDFGKKTGETSYLIFDGEKTTFTMLTNSVGKVYRASNDEKQFANLTLIGTVDGKPAVLTTNKYEHFTLTVDGKVVFTANSSLSQLANGGVNYETGEVFLYSFDEKEQKPYSYKFIIDKVAGTFSYVPRDTLFGKYVSGSMYVFLDGYGTGVISFDTSSYYTTLLTYTEEDGEVSVRYRNTSPSFTHGDGAEFYIAPLLNVLTVKRADDASLDGREFVNSVITDGAVIRISSPVLGAGEGRNELLSKISILTKDGELTGSAKSDCVSTSAVKFTVAGFYQFTVTVTVGGETVTRYYAVQILGADYDGSRLLGNYTGIVSGSNYLSIDRFGRVSLSVGDTVFRGLVTSMTEDTVYARVYDANRSAVTVRATVRSDGLLEVQGSGAVGFHDLYTVGTVRSAGLVTKEKVTTVLRAVTVGNETMLFLSSSASSAGVQVGAVSLNGLSFTQNGVILRLAKEDGTEVCLRVTAWGNLSAGLAFADAVRGTYTSEGNPELFLDGFGNATFDGVTVPYTVTDGIVFVTVSGTVRAFRTDRTAGTYTELSYVAGNAMLAGKALSASYTFTCSGYSYSADTRFVFGTNGRVTVYTTSSDHDGECEEDVYLPAFGSKTGVSGTYSVTGDRVTVTVGGETFVFRIPNVVSVSRMICESTTLSSGEQGYFRTGETFYSDET